MASFMCSGHVTRRILGFSAFALLLVTFGSLDHGNRESSPRKEVVTNPRATTVLLTATPGYVCVLENWLSRTRKFSDIHVTVVFDQSKTPTSAGDRRAFEATVEGHRFVSVRWSSSGTSDNKSSFWSWRLHLLSEIFIEEQWDSVLLSDSDAVWLRNPMNVIEAGHKKGFHVIASTGTFPPYVRNIWSTHSTFNSTLCMGFISFCSTATSFLLELATRCGASCDDQMMINNMLLDFNIQWNEVDDGDVTGTDAMSHVGFVNVTGKNLKIGALSPGYTVRGNEWHNNAAVVHPRAKKTGDSKEKMLRLLGLWDPMLTCTSSLVLPY